MGNRVHHAAHDAVSALVKAHLDQGVLIVGLHESHGIGLDRTVLQGDAFRKATNDLVIDPTLDVSQVSLENLVRRVSHAVGEFTIVGQQYESRGLGV